MTNPFKGMNKDEKKSFRKLVKIMTCDLDCKKCKKNLQQCIRDIRFCLNMLLKERLENLKKNRGKNDTLELMVTALLI